MKAIFSLLMLTFYLSMSAQSNLQIVKNVFPFKEDKILYSQTIDSLGKSKDELFKISKKFMIDNYRSANDVIQEESKEDGVIIGRGIIIVPHYFGLMQGVNVNIIHSVRIRCKENKVNIEVYGLRYEAYYPPSQYSSGSNVKMTLEERFVSARRISSKDIDFMEATNKQVVGIINRFIKAVKSSDITDDDF